jgi:hypothetical protein
MLGVIFSIQIKSLKHNKKIKGWTLKF